MVEIYEFPGGGWLIDEYRGAGAQYQISINKGDNTDKDGHTVIVTTMQEAKVFYKQNKAYLAAKMAKLGTPGKQEPETGAT